MRKVALLEEKERERPAGGLTLLRTSYVVGPPAINARRGGQVRKAQDDGRTNEECEGGGEKSERDERKVVIERANFSTCGQWRERARKRTRHVAFTEECSQSIVFRKRDENALGFT